MDKRASRLLGAASFLLFVGYIGAASAGTINLTEGSIDYSDVVGGSGQTHLEWATGDSLSTDS